PCRRLAMRQGVEKQGIPPAAISTVGYSVRNEARVPGRAPKGEPDWFVARNAIRVEVAPLEQLGALIDVALASGANRVDSIAFLAKEEREWRRKALALAVEHARAQAEAMAGAAGGKLGELLELSAGDAPSIPRPLFAERAAAAGTVVEPAELVIAERVVARWRFAPPGSATPR
ncbi:MAG TPA: SIMPL domain-containing protein, partial [Burkholderiales bacterium]|nr:SIMPL domain-containing protein [Burkholderiales bacterium]